MSDQPKSLEGGEHDVPALMLDLDVWLQGSIDIADRLTALIPQRTLAIVLTKMEEAQLWLTKVEGGK